MTSALVPAARWYATASDASDPEVSSPWMLYPSQATAGEFLTMRSASAESRLRGSASFARSALIASMRFRFSGAAITTQTSSRPSCVRPVGMIFIRGHFASIARSAARISAWCAVNVPSGCRSSVSGAGTAASYVVPAKKGSSFCPLPESPNGMPRCAGAAAACGGIAFAGTLDAQLRSRDVRETTGKRAASRAAMWGRGSLTGRLVP